MTDRPALDPFQSMTEGRFICVTCHKPILLTDEWSWLDSHRREPEHDACYSQRFARQFPAAQKRAADED